MSAGQKTGVSQTPMKLGIIAGGGKIPAMLMDRCKKNNIDFVTVGIEGYAEIEPDLWNRLGATQRVEQFFRIKKVTDIVLIGRIDRPSITNCWPDWETFWFLVKILIGSLGDSKILTALRKEIEKRGFRLRGVHEFLPELLMPEGGISKILPAPIFDEDIELGFIAAKKHGEADKGQAVLVKNGNIIAREKRSGTNAMIREHGQSGAVLVKACKPQQDENLDLPTIGPETVHLCIQRNMKGIVGEAGKTLLVDQDAVKKLADQHDFFVFGASNEP